MHWYPVVIECFPSLEHLELHLEDMECTFEEMVHSLAGLKSHKSLSTLKCSLELHLGTESPSSAVPYKRHLASTLK